MSFTPIEIAPPLDGLRDRREECAKAVKTWESRLEYLRGETAKGESHLAAAMARLAEYDAAIARLEPQPEAPQQPGSEFLDGAKFPLLKRLAIEIGRHRGRLPEIWPISDYAEAETEYLAWCAGRFGGRGAEPIRARVGLPNFVWRALAIVPKVEGAA